MFHNAGLKYASTGITLLLNVAHFEAQSGNS